MAVRNQGDIVSQPRTGMWCFVAWCLGVVSVIAVALIHGVEPSALIHVSHDGRVSLWQALIFSLSMSSFGFWMGLTTKLRRIPEDPAGIAYNLKLYAKGGGWIFAIGGIIVALRIIGLLQAQ